MKQRFFHHIDRLATGRNVVIIIVIWLSYAMFVMGLSKGTAPDSTGPIDLTFAPSPMLICTMIESYGESVRQEYMWGEVTWDGLYPLTYGLMLLLGLSYGVKRTEINFTWKDNLLFLPLLVMAADYGENAGIVSLLLSYPACARELAILTSIFVTAKWVLTVTCFSLLFVLAFLGLWRKLILS